MERRDITDIKISKISDSSIIKGKKFEDENFFSSCER